MVGQVFGPWYSTRDGNSVAVAQVVVLSLAAPPSRGAAQKPARLHFPHWGLPQGLARRLWQALSPCRLQLAQVEVAVASHDGPDGVAVAGPE